MGWGNRCHGGWGNLRHGRAPTAGKSARKPKPGGSGFRRLQKGQLRRGTVVFLEIFPAGCERFLEKIRRAGIVPGQEFTLRHLDEVTITVGELTLVNTVDNDFLRVPIQSKT